MIDLKPTHQKFIRSLENTQQAVCAVAVFLSKLGLTVQVPGLHIAPTPEERHQFRDLGDLFVLKRVEVKQLTYDFSGREDFPFPDFLICSQDSFDSAKEKPLGFVTLNRIGTHAAMVNCDTRHLWRTRLVKNRTRGTEANQYACDLDIPLWVNLEEIVNIMNGEGNVRESTGEEGTPLGNNGGGIQDG